MITVTKIFTFDAAHKLPYHEGLCKNLHGHTYKVEVEMAGYVKADNAPDKGMIVDFKMLKELVQELILSKYDHAYLNDLHENPTAEVMVGSMGNLLKERCTFLPFYPVRVRLWETPTSYAEWRP